MLEYFTYKKYRQHKETKAREEKEKADKIREEKGKAPEDPPNVVLGPDDESFLEALIAADGPAPPLPPRPEIAWESSSEVRGSEENSAESADEATPGASDEGRKEAKSDKEGDKKDKKKKHRSIYGLFKKKDDTLKPEAVSPEEEAKEERDISRILRTLNIASVGDRAVSLTPDVSALAQRFTLILKDLTAGVPTAYNDLIKLIEDRDGLLDRTFAKLPSSLQKLVMQLPDKVTASIAPEVLAAAAKAQGVEVEGEKGLREAAMSLLTVRGLQEMVTKPGALAGMLRSIVEALKLRFPAFMGTNLLWSVAIFRRFYFLPAFYLNFIPLHPVDNILTYFQKVLLFVLWYCHKRGKEERLKKEETEKGEAATAGPVVEEVTDDEAPDGPSPPARIEGSSPVPLIKGPDDAGEGTSRQGAVEGSPAAGSERSK